MMNIPPHIEALLLDYVEGRLDAEKHAEAAAYLAAHPEVEMELREMGAAKLTPREDSLENHDALKLPGGSSEMDVSAREALYMLALDGELSPEEAQTFQSLLKREAYRREYREWQNTIVKPPKTNLDKSGLYRSVPVPELKGENLEPTPDLVVGHKPFSTLRLEDMSWEDVPRLKPPVGVFFPDKSALRRKVRKPIRIWYAVASAAACLLLIWMFPFSGEPEAMEARLPMTEMQKKAPDIPKSNTPRDLPKHLEVHTGRSARILDWIDAPPSETVSEIPKALAQTGNGMENDPEEKEEDSATERGEVVIHGTDIPEIVLESTEPRGIPLIEVDRPLALHLPESEWPIPDPTTTDSQAGISAHTSEQNAALTPGEWVAQLAREKLESGIEESLLVLADGVKRKAGEILDAEVKQSTAQTQAGERKTVEIRIGGVAFSRSTAR